MKKVIKLTESDLTRIVKRVIKENNWEKYGFSDEETFLEEYNNADEYASELYMSIDRDITNLIGYTLSNVWDEISNIVDEYQNNFKEEYGQFASNEEGLYNENINDLMKINIKNTDDRELSSQISALILDNLLGNKNSYYQ
jgi:hypothetical protein